MNTRWMGILALAGSVNAFAADGIDNLIADGKTSLSFRYRFEGVDDDAFDLKAKASTLRTRLGFKSGAVHGFSLLAEFDDIREIGTNNFNAGAGNTPGRIEYPIIADPEGTEVNQAYIEYAGSYVAPRLGRQRINLDNQRFIGGVG